MESHFLPPRSFPAPIPAKILYHHLHDEMEIQLSCRRSSIASLPADVIREIFDHFKDRNLYHPTGAVNHEYRCNPNKENFKTVQALRLVCQAFGRLASLLLLPALLVEISTESLSRAEQLTRNPDIAAGIRLVRVSLAYRPEEIAQSPILYRDQQLEILWSLHHTAVERSGFGRADLGGKLSECDPESKKGKILKGISRYKLAIQARSTWPCEKPEEPADAATDEESASCYRHFLSQCYDEYVQQYHDQERALGTFATSLAVSISRLPYIRLLAFYERPKHFVYEYGAKDPLDIAAIDKSELRQLMVAAHSWSDLEFRPTPHIHSIKLLWQLPIAIYNTGIQLRGLHVEPFPVKTHLDKLEPYDEDSIPAWKTLCAAFGSLEHVGIDTGTLQKAQLLVNEQAYVNRYIQAALYGPCLERTIIDLAGFGPQDRVHPVDCTEYHSLGSVLSGMKCQNLRMLSIWSVSFDTEKELLGFLAGTGEKLQRLTLFKVGLKEGGWTEALRMLRNKFLMAPQRSTMHDVDIHYLYGGGFEKAKKEAMERARAALDPDAEFYSYEEDDRYWKRVTRYVQGLKEANPVSRFEERG